MAAANGALNLYHALGSRDPGVTNYKLVGV